MLLWRFTMVTVTGGERSPKRDSVVSSITYDRSNSKARDDSSSVDMDWMAVAFNSAADSAANIVPSVISVNTNAAAAVAFATVGTSAERQK
jgi:hypothetical protein